MTDHSATQPAPVVCRICGDRLPPDARSCETCGTPVDHCPNCQHPLGAGDEACWGCGKTIIRGPAGNAVGARDGTVVSAALASSADPNATVRTRDGELTPADLAPSFNPTDPWARIVHRLRSATAGEFEIQTELGRGGMAIVYLAREIALSRKVAIKLMSPALLTDASMIERFRQEAVTVANLSHPHIITIHAVRQIEDLHFFVMKYVRGRSLDHIIREMGPLPISMVRGLLFMIGSALGYAHRRGVIHRDVKPANVLIDEDGCAVVTDFGIAKVAENPTHTQTGTVVGTPAYISPEQCYASGVTAASDQYSLGIVAFELLTGATPFSGNPFTVMNAHTAQPIPDLLERRADCPPALAAAVMRMLSKDPGDRWPTVQHALAALEAAPLSEEDPVRVELARYATTIVRPAQNGSGPTYGAANDTETTPEVRSVSFLAPPNSLRVGESIPLSLSAIAPDGTTLSSVRAAWKSGNPTVISVDARQGVITALAPGMATITASVGSAQCALSLMVSSRRVASVNISIPPGPVHVGERVQLSAHAEDDTHEAMGQPVTWTTADTAVASLSDDGVLIANAPGKVLICAESGGVKSSVRIEIEPANAGGAVPGAQGSRGKVMVGSAVVVAALAAGLFFLWPAPRTSVDRSSATLAVTPAPQQTGAAVVTSPPRSVPPPVSAGSDANSPASAVATQPPTPAATDTSAPPAVAAGNQSKRSRQSDPPRTKAATHTRDLARTAAGADTSQPATLPADPALDLELDNIEIDMAKAKRKWSDKGDAEVALAALRQVRSHLRSLVDSHPRVARIGQLQQQIETSMSQISSACLRLGEPAERCR